MAICKNGHRYKKGKQCPKCHRAWTKRYERTAKGRANKLFRNMKVSAAKRDLNIEFTSKQFVLFCLLNPDFNRLFLLWERSGYDTCKSVSPDRVDPLKGYEPGNIRFITWEDNRYKGCTEDKALHSLPPEEVEWGGKYEEFEDVQF